MKRAVQKTMLRQELDLKEPGQFWASSCCFDVGEYIVHARLLDGLLRRRARLGMASTASVVPTLISTPGSRHLAAEGVHPT